MKLFTSDLDRTLIFSKRTIEKEASERICIEHLHGKEISYVTKAIVEQLEQVNATMQFVPVTTRSRAQYERISLFQQTVIPVYAIVANGGIILRNGQVDLQWQQQMTQLMASLPLPISKLQQQFAAQLSKPYFLSNQLMDELFFVYGVDTMTVQLDELQQLDDQLAPFGWTSCLNGRKLYILPAQMTKGAAVAYLKRQQHYEMHFAAGDSYLDLSMLKLAQKSYTPAHGELALRQLNAAPVEVIDEKGAVFAEHCLEKLLHI